MSAVLAICVGACLGALARWQLGLWLNTGGVLPWGGTAWPVGAFLRHDVFGPQADPRPAVHERAQGWQAALQGWLLAHPQVRTCNADMAPEALYKVAAQVAARQVWMNSQQKAQ